MSTESRYQLVESMYQRAVDLPAERRQAFLEEQCADDPDLKSEVNSLVEHYETAGDGFLEQPVHELAGLSAARRIPERIGCYLIVRLIGEGGMGTVFEARQESPRRSVAVKVIRPGIPSRESLRRFENEAQILGRLQHPGIAHIYEAGVAEVITPGNAPLRQSFFAMEFVHGKPLNEYLEDSDLHLNDRLELFTRIGDAIEYAHRAGIIHRDLKPANILVTTEGKPKILDFGVARVTNSDVQMTTIHTDLAQVVGTLPYMSPEQVDQLGEQIDARSDVYALGVILYEMVAGRLPYDLTGMPITRAARVIAEDAPTSLGSLNRGFRGDLDTIVNKVLEKEPLQRYQSVAALVTDVRRYLHREPIAARPTSTAYQIRKFAQRNPALVAAVAATIVVLLAGVFSTTILALRERAQAGEAKTRAAQAQAVTGFLRDMIAAVEPANARGQEVTVRETLEEAARRLATGELRSQPEVEAALQQTIGETYISLGNSDLAKPHLEAALNTLRKLHGNDHPDTVDCLAQLALADNGLGQFDEAERKENEVLRLCKARFGERHPMVATALENLSETIARSERNDEAERLCRTALSIRRDHAEEDPRSLARCLSSLGALLTKLGRYEEAESQLREALKIRRESLPADHPDLANSVSNLGTLLLKIGSGAEAERYLTEAVEMRKRILDPTHPDLLSSMNDLSMLLVSLGRNSEAVPLMRQIVEIQRSTLGENHADLGESLLNLAFTLLDSNKWDEAEKAGKEGLEITRRVFGDRHPNVATGLHNLAVQYMKLGQLERAIPLLREALSILAEVYGEDHPLTAHCHDTLGAIYSWLGRFDEAMIELEQALSVRREKLGPEHGKVGITCKNIAAAQLGMGNYAAARDAAQQAVDSIGDGKPLFMERSDAVLHLAEARIRLNEATDQTESNIKEATRRLDAWGAPWWMVADGKRVLGLWLAQQGRQDDALSTFSDARNLLHCEKEVNPFACKVILDRINQAEAELLR